MATRQRACSSELSLSSCKTHRRTSSVIICNGSIHSFNSPVSMTESLRTLELIRQLSFDTSTPKIIESSTSDTNKMVSLSTLCRNVPKLELDLAPPAPPNTPTKSMLISPPLPPHINRLEPHMISPPRNLARSATLSDLTDGECYDATDFDNMMEHLHEQEGPPNRRRLASDQSPYAVSSASPSSLDDSFAWSSESDPIRWDDPTGCIINLGLINQAETSALDDGLDPPLMLRPRLSSGTLQEWNKLCEEEGNVIDKRQYISSVLSRPASVGDEKSSSLESTEEVHMLVAPPLSEDMSLSYTNTGAPSTISISSEFQDVEEVCSNDDGGVPLSYSRSIDKSILSSHADDMFQLENASPVNKHRRHMSDGFVLQLLQENAPKSQAHFLMKRPSHQRCISLRSIPELKSSLKCQMGSDAVGLVVGALPTSCDNSFESFVASENDVLRFD